MPVLSSPSDPVFGPDVAPEMMELARASVSWEPGTRRARSAVVSLQPLRGDALTVELEPLATFHMRGLGYLHPEWGHGQWHGALDVHTERWKVADHSNGVDPFYLHIQQIVRATMGERVGVGMFEQLVLGPHEPSGFTDLFGGAR